MRVLYEPAVQVPSRNDDGENANVIRRLAASSSDSEAKHITVRGTCSSRHALTGASDGQYDAQKQTDLSQCKLILE